MDEQNTTIRKATITDIQAVQNLIDQYYESMLELFPSVYAQYEGNAKTDEEIEEFIHSDHKEVAIAERDNQIAGLVCIRESSVSDIAFLKHRRYGLITYLVVDKERRNQGIGRQLLQHAIDWTHGRGIAQIELTVWFDNEVARELYQNAGFRPLTMQMGMNVFPADGRRLVNTTLPDCHLSIRNGGAADMHLIEALYGQLSEDTSNVERDYMTIINDPNSECLILQDESDPVGAAMVHFKTSLSLGKTMEIDEIVIDVHLRGKGYGTALMRHCMSIASEKGIESVTLNCSEKKMRLHAFYERLGFRHRMRNYSFIPRIDE